MMQDGMMMMGPMMMITTILVLGALIAGIVWLVRTLTDDGRPGRRRAVERLELRYAGGEIDREEYLLRRDDLDARA